ncbi:MAG: relaxase domain-containing protein [Actinomycetia bacterium]|nr:relaxase domain-containing protein [Actinomycetes bacterium]
MTAAQFLQHDSRDHDPQLHVHGPVLNKVMCSDGVVRALDFTLFTQWRDGAAAICERVSEAAAWEELGAWWETRVDGQAREIRGVDPAESSLFSKRTANITPALQQLIAQFRDDMGREPTRHERAGLAEEATLSTRQGKVFGGETRDGQLARWATEYDAAFGRDMATIATTVVGAAPASHRPVVRAGRHHARAGRDGGRAAVVDRVQPDAGGVECVARPPGRRPRARARAH